MRFENSVGLSNAASNGGYLQRVYASDGGRHGLRRSAEHIDIGIVNGLVPVCRAGVDHHLPAQFFEGCKP